MIRQAHVARVLRHAPVTGARLRALLALAGAADAQGVTVLPLAMLAAQVGVPRWYAWWLRRDLTRRGLLAAGPEPEVCAVLVGLTADEVQAVRARLDTGRAR
ncbi:hypothetical protein F8S13_22160 [Chloroflexia bacterium SDU3-3]|nr:hypothetical protein F8S13_22160 [Chloroflexia bacterium SDU3-3]